MKHGELTSILISICIKVHETLGPGLLESVYEECICYELTKLGIPFLRQQGISFYYDDVKMDIGFRADILVDNTVIMELKSQSPLIRSMRKLCLPIYAFQELK